MTVSTRSARVLIVLAAASIFGASAALPSLFAQDAAPAAPAASAKRPQTDMQAMNRALTAIKAQIKDETQKSATADLIVQLQQASMAAKQDMPPTIASMEGAEKQTRLADYRKEMNKLIRQELDLEDQVLAGDTAKAGETLTALAATQSEGHMQFRGRGGRGGGGGGAGGAGGGGAPGAR